jgi:hypothetical protein
MRAVRSPAGINPARRSIAATLAPIQKLALRQEAKKC